MRVGEFSLQGWAAGGWRVWLPAVGRCAEPGATDCHPVQSGRGGFSGLTLIVSMADECPSRARRHTEISLFGPPDGSEQAL